MLRVCPKTTVGWMSDCRWLDVGMMSVCCRITAGLPVGYHRTLSSALPAEACSYLTAATGDPVQVAGIVVLHAWWRGRASSPDHKWWRVVMKWWRVVVE